MSKDKKSKKFDHVVEELEAQFHSLQSKLGKAKDDYLKRHEKDFEKAKKKVEELKKKFNKATANSQKAAEEAKAKGTKAAKNQWKKARAAASLMANSLKEAKGILSTAEEKLNTAKPFDRKLAARAKALEAFEKEWEKKQKAEEAAKAKKASASKQKASKKKAPAKKKAAVKKKAVKKAAASKKASSEKEVVASTPVSTEENKTS